MANDTANVSTGKGVAGGYAFRAPVGPGTTIPTDNTTSLGAEFVGLGYISEDGISESIETDTENIVDMNGDVILAATSSREETITFTLVEVMEEALKVAYGDANVAESSGVITVQHNGSDTGQHVYVFELLLKNNRKWRQVVPVGAVTEVGELAISSGEVVGREITITCAADTTGNTVYDYIDE